jgi:hypothetical protein
MSEMTPQFRDLLRHTFGIKKGTPVNPAPLPIHATMPKPKGVSIAVSAQSQRIYNPNLPPAPPKIPPKAIAEQGIAGAMDQSGRWATGEEK